MDILMILMISPVLFFAAQFVSKKFKVAPPIFYLLMGVLFGGSIGIVHIFGNLELMPNIVMYNNVGLWLLFFGAGFSMDIKKMRSSGKLTTNLGILPVCIEGVVMTVVVYFALKVLPLGFELTIWQIAMIMLLFACASLANVIPPCTSLAMNGYGGKNKITELMLASSIIDNYSPLPLFVIAVVLTIAPGMGIELSPLMIVAIAVGVIVALVVLIAISTVIGKLQAKLLAPLSDKVKEDINNKKLGIIYTLIYFGICTILIFLSGPLKSLGVLLIIGFAMGINKTEKNGLGGKISFNASMLFGMFGSPIIFSYVGSLIDIKALLNPMMLGFGIGMTFLAIAIKGVITKALFKEDRFTEGEKKFAVACFIPKGIILVNFSLILKGPLEAMGMGYVIEFMILFAAISIVASVPLGVTLLSNAGGKWLHKEETTKEA